MAKAEQMLLEVCPHGIADPEDQWNLFSLNLHITACSRDCFLKLLKEKLEES